MKHRLVYVFTVIIFLSLSIYFLTLSLKKPDILTPLSQSTQFLDKITSTLIPSPTFTPSPTPTTFLAPTLNPTPTLTPIPSFSPPTSDQLEDLFTKYANKFSVDRELLKRIAACESNFNPNAVFGDYIGLFQFSTNAWISSRTLMEENSDPSLRTNAEESIKTAAFKLSRGESSSWPNCNK